MKVVLPVGLVAACISIGLLLTALLVPREINQAVGAGLRERTIWKADSPADVHEHYLRNDRPEDPPLYVHFYVFNITNVEEVQAGAKPALQQLGPYTYIKHSRKLDARFDVAGRVHFKPYTFYTGPVHELTHGSLADVVHTANIPLLGILAKADPRGDRHALVQTPIKAAIEVLDRNDTTGLFMRRSVKELLWGYEDPLLAKLSWVLPNLPTSFRLIQNATSAAEALEGTSTVVNTGSANISAVMDTEVWHNLTVITSWRPPFLEAVRGTDATQFRPGLGAGDRVQVWAGDGVMPGHVHLRPQHIAWTIDTSQVLGYTVEVLAEDLYRSVTFVVNETTTDLNGIKLQRLMPDPANGNPDANFFQRIQGLMNITSPTAGGPGGRAGQQGPHLFLSQAHFCGADSRLTESVSGLSCNISKHVTYLDVESLSGITFRAAKRLMLSTEFSNIWSVIEPSVLDTILPVFWADESSEATETQCNQFVSKVYGVRLTSRLVHGICLAVAILMGCIAFICLTEPFWNDSGDKKSDVEEPLLAGQPQAPSEASATAAAEPAASAGTPAADEPAASDAAPSADEAVTSAAAPSADGVQPSASSRTAGGGKEAAKSAQSGPVGSHPV